MSKINNIVLFLVALSVPFYEINHGLFAYLLFKNTFILFIGYYIVFSIIVNRKRESKIPSKLLVSLIILFIVQIISGLFAYDIDLALQKIFSEFQFLVILVIVNNLIRNDKSFECIFRGLLLGFLISCGLGLLQYLGYQQFNIFSSSELNANAGFEVKEDNEILTRIWGPFGNSLTFSEYLAVSGILLYSYYRFFKKHIIVALLLICLTIVCIVLTVGRIALFSAIFTFAFIELIYIMQKTASKFWYLIIGILILSFSLFFLFSSDVQQYIGPLFSRFTNSSEDLKAGRLGLWVKGFQAYQKNMVFGVGPGNLHLALNNEGFQFQSKLYNFEGQHVESYYLTILYVYGILGLIFCVRIYYYLLSYSFKLFKVLKLEYKTFSYGGIIFGAVTALSICNITNPALIFDQRIKMLFIFLISIINNSYLFYRKTGLNFSVTKTRT